MSTDAIDSPGISEIAEPPVVAQFDFKSDPRLVLDLARDRLNHQISFSDSLDSKIAALFSAASAIVGILAAVLSLAPDEPDRVGITLLILAASAYVVVTAVAAVANWPQRLRIGPSVDWAWNRSQEVGEEQFLPELISGYMDYWRRNRTGNFVKAFALRAAYVAVLIETVCMLAAIAIVSH